MAAEALEGAIEPVARGDVVGIERERALGVVGRLVGAAEGVVDLGEAHVLVRDHLGRGAGGARRVVARLSDEQREPLLPHLRGALVCARGDSRRRTSSARMRAPVGVESGARATARVSRWVASMAPGEPLRERVSATAVGAPSLSVTRRAAA